MSTVVVPLQVAGADVDLAQTPELYVVAGTSFTVVGYAFPSAGSKAIYLRFGSYIYGAGTITLEVHWESRSGSTTGNVQWVAALAAITPGDAQSIETKAFATAQNTTTTVNGTARGSTLTTISIVNLDSAANGDDVWIKLTRGTDTMTGDAVAISAFASYDDGNSGSPGSGDVVGPASSTTTAIARYNGTTGKLIQNSAVSMDSSGNLTSAGTYNTVLVDKHGLVNELASAVAISAAITMTAITGMSIALPRAGTYWISGTLSTTATATLTPTFAANVSANLTRIALSWLNPLTATSQSYGFQAASIAAGAAGNTGFATGSRTVLTALGVLFSGSVTVSGAATVQLLASRSTSTLTINAGSAWLVREA